MNIEKEVKVLEGTEQQNRAEVNRQIRAAILPFFADDTDDMLPAICTALAGHPYWAVTDGTDLTIIWDTGQRIAIASYPNVGYIERASAACPYFALIAKEMGLAHLIPDEILIILFRSRRAVPASMPQSR